MLEAKIGVSFDDKLFKALNNHDYLLSQFISIGGQLSKVPCVGARAL